MVKLQRFKTDRSKKIRNILITLGAIIILIGGIIFYRSYALYKEDKTFNVIKGQIPNFIRNDLEIAYTINGQKTTTPPTKGSYKVATSCDNATAEWDYNNWGVLISNATSEKIKCSVDFNEIYSEEILNGTDPVISDNLIAVNIASDGTVTKADTTKKWYSYENKEWANAVILKNKTITYEDGTTIPEDNIESYFVWIPKYSYQLWNISDTSIVEEEPTASSAHTISIKFGTINTSDSNTGECTTPLISGESGNCTVGDYMTHPAFINSNTNGLWVGKFETGYDGATTTAEAGVNSQDSTKIIVKPNVYSWRLNSVYNFFMTLYNYNRNLDSHMMKNTEWGAVAYLSHSEYGINNEIWINNNKYYVTGCVGDSPSAADYYGCQNTYNTDIGYNGSTTGNITGIYDMSGGAFDIMAAYIKDTPGYSGFSTDDLTTYKNYLDVYNSESMVTSYQYRILGDATGEMGHFYYYNRARYSGWYSDYSGFIEEGLPWFMRGGVAGTNAYSGQFYFYSENGAASNSDTVRLVLAI
jgi:hypothetical protein